MPEHLQDAPSQHQQQHQKLQHGANTSAATAPCLIDDAVRQKERDQGKTDEFVVMLQKVLLQQGSCGQTLNGFVGIDEDVVALEVEVGKEGALVRAGMASVISSLRKAAALVESRVV